MTHFLRLVVLKTIAAAALLLCVLPATAQDSSPSLGDPLYVPGEYRIFTSDGQPASMDDVAAAMANVQVVFVGETHDDPTGHMMELKILEQAYNVASPTRGVALSLEFFQADVQNIVNEYLADDISENAFLADARPWPRYKTDYRPSVEFAKENQFPVIAANAPRRYTNRVSRMGRESLNELSDYAKSFLPPLPYGEPSKAYRDQWVQTMMSVMEQETMICGKPIAVEPATESDDAAAAHTPPAGNHGDMGNILHSQALWDASMAYRIGEHLASAPNSLVVHMVGSFHVARGTGTPEHLETYRPGTKSIIIMMRAVSDVDTFEAAPSGVWGDFVIQTDESKTLESIECARAD
jgi:uncharacterized iron-regulated protein